jgi:cold shock CspA family protein
MAGGAAPASVYALRAGSVSWFDDHVGAGTVDDAEGRRWWFHCTRIADGSRTVDEGAAVSFRVVPGPTGLEAVDVAPVPGGA